MAWEHESKIENLGTTNSDKLSIWKAYCYLLFEVTHLYCELQIQIISIIGYLLHVEILVFFPKIGKQL